MYVNQRVRRTGELNGKSFKGVSKTKKKKKMKRLTFITQFKIELLLPLTSCRNVLGKMPGQPRPTTGRVDIKLLLHLT